MARDGGSDGEPGARRGRERPAVTILRAEADFTDPDLPRERRWLALYLLVHLVDEHGRMGSAYRRVLRRAARVPGHWAEGLSLAAVRAYVTRWIGVDARADSLPPWDRIADLINDAVHPRRALEVLATARYLHCLAAGVENDAELHRPKWLEAGMDDITTAMIGGPGWARKHGLPEADTTTDTTTYTKAATESATESDTNTNTESETDTESDTRTDAETPVPEPRLPAPEPDPAPAPEPPPLDPAALASAPSRLGPAAPLAPARLAVTFSNSDPATPDPAAPKPPVPKPPAPRPPVPRPPAPKPATPKPPEPKPPVPRPPTAQRPKPRKSEARTPAAPRPKARRPKAQAGGPQAAGPQGAGPQTTENGERHAYQLLWTVVRVHREAQTRIAELEHQVEQLREQNARLSATATATATATAATTAAADRRDVNPDNHPDNHPGHPDGHPDDHPGDHRPAIPDQARRTRPDRPVADRHLALDDPPKPFTYPLPAELP